MISHEERKLYYDKDYYDTDRKPPYRDWWWSDPSVWSPRAKAIKIALNPSSVLDCGCAKGSLVKYLKCLYGIEAYGFDYSEYAIKDSSNNNMGNTIFIHDIVLDKLPFDDRYFDAVVCFDFLEHIERDSIKSVCEELQRVAASYILIRQPFCSMDELLAKALHKICCEKPITERWELFKQAGLREIVLDKENIEHPSTIPREELMQYFGTFTEFISESYIYDIMMGSTYKEFTPVLPFYDTLLLRRIE